VRLGETDGRFPISRETRLGPVERLTEGIATKCVQSTHRREHRFRHSHEQPS
jgi:hypothetical protein